MQNMTIYNKVRNVPQEALKPIKGGRLQGMTDINPMWRIQQLTECYGPTGVGWYTKTIKKWLEHGCSGQISAFVDIELYVKNGNEWSMPIEGNGGSSFVAQEKNGLYQSDECFKMAYTDALSVACKALGFGADIYWEQGRTKYSNTEQAKANELKPIPIKDIAEESRDIRKEAWDMILKLCKNDQEEAMGYLKSLTTFKGKDGNVVQGKTDINTITEKGIQVVYGKVKAEFLKMESEELNKTVQDFEL